MDTHYIYEKEIERGTEGKKECERERERERTKSEAKVNNEIIFDEGK